MKRSLGLFAGLGAGAVVGAGAAVLAFLFLGDGAQEPGREASAIAGRDGPAGGGAGRGVRRGGYVPVVAMATAERGAIGRTIEVIGQARSLRSVAIVSEVTGLVEEVAIAPGKRVKAGEMLLQIDDAEQQVLLTRARAEFPIAEQNAARYIDLATDEAASALEAEQAKNSLSAARAQLRAAQVAVAQRKIIAPFDGIAGLTDVEAGDYLRAGDPVTTLDDTSSIIIAFAVPQEAAGFIDIGQPVTARLTSSAGQAYEGLITAVDSRVDTDSRSLNVEAQFENPDGRLIPGAVFTVETTAEGEPAVSLPGLAIQWDRAGAYVWRRGRDGVAERASVVILQRTDDIVLVEGDVKVGDAIAVEGADRVRRGVPLPASPAASGSLSVGAAE
ncbi:MAG: efflux RND transporter periplasmic adaptor subunit [Pseudomonadota bacterium]